MNLSLIRKSMAAKLTPKALNIVAQGKARRVLRVLSPPWGSRTQATHPERVPQNQSLHWLTAIIVLCMALPTFGQEQQEEVYKKAVEKALSIATEQQESSQDEVELDFTPQTSNGSFGKPKRQPSGGEWELGHSFGKPKRQPSGIAWQISEQNNQRQQQALQKMQGQLERLQAELLEAHAAQDQQAKNLPPLENGTLNAYRLKYIDPNLLAETLESFLGTNQLRLVPDEKNNILLTYASPEVSEQISNLVKVLDANNESTYETASPQSEELQSLQIRIYWLIDDDSTPIQYMEPTEYLPESVLQAVKQLGLQTPRLVTQSATSVASSPAERSPFQFSFPALVGNQILNFESEGQMTLGQQPQLDLRVKFLSRHNPIELAGKLTAPLGHYMVLGTTNYASEDTYTSRFAFVVQIVEAKSFPPEE